MTDLTLLYYSAHSLPEHCEANVRKRLPQDYPIVSVTQKETNLGFNICVGSLGKSHYNCYKQISIGLQAIKTEYVAMVEDDTLYPPEHFSSYRPWNLAYNRSMWFLEDEVYWHKGWTGMFACIARTQFLQACLGQRFTAYPVEPLPRRSQRHFWKEPPGEYFATSTPLITLNYYNGLDGKKRSSTHKRAETTSLPYWGPANQLFNKLWTP